jgi:hypothetical protein
MTMTIRRWITLASAAAMIAGVGACKDNTGGSSAGTRTSSEPQGRRSDTLPRARDAGADMSGTSSGSATGSTSPSQDTAGSASGSSSDTTKK